MSSCMNDNFFQQPQILGGEITTYTYVYNYIVYIHEQTRCYQSKVSINMCNKSKQT